MLSFNTKIAKKFFYEFLPINIKEILMNIRNKFIAVMFGLLSVVPTKAQKTAEVVSHAPIVERVVEDTVKVKNKISKDISLRTFQFGIA